MRRWLKWILAILVIAALAAGVAWALSQRKVQQQAAAAQASQRVESAVELAPGDLVQVKSRALVQALPISGTLKAATVVVIKARVAGELQAMTLREGDLVRAGQTIGRIDATDAQARLRQAQQQAESAKAQVEIARRTFENNRSLVDQGFISKSALDTSASSLAAAEANYRAAVAGVDMMGKSLEDTVLRSPITGQVSQRLAQSGERMALDGRVVEIVDLSRLELEASISPADSLQVLPGQTALLQIEGTASTVKARVVRINPTAVAGSRSVTAYLALDPAPGLRQGLFAQGALTTGLTQAPSVPLSVVRTDKPQPYVQMVTNNKVVHQPVEFVVRGGFEGQRMAGIKGVPEGATLINGQVGALREGTLVKLAAGTK